jgi:hypothetical protein
MKPCCHGDLVWSAALVRARRYGLTIILRIARFLPIQR